MTHVLIVEGDQTLATRIAEVLTREQVTVAAAAEEAVKTIRTGAIDFGIATVTMFRNARSCRELHHVPWIVVVDSVDDEIAMHRDWPDLNARYLYRDVAERYLEVLPLRIRAASSRERLVATIVNRFPGMIAYWDDQERCRFANGAYRNWFGVAPHDLLGQTLRNLLGPIYPLNEPYIRGALRGETQQFQRTIPDPNGGPPRHALATYTPDIDNGVVRGFVVIVTDITEEYRLQQALSERERRWATLFNILPVGVAVIDSQGTIVDQNPALASILGIDRNGLEQGRHKRRRYIHANGHPILPNEFPSTRALAERRVIGPSEIGIIKEDDSTIWTSVSAAPFPEEDKVVIVTRDTTAEKAGAARFEAIVGASPIPYVLNDAQGNITYLNPAFVTTFGYTSEDIPTLEHWWPLAYPEPSYRKWAAEEWVARLEKSKRDNTPFESMELVIQAKDGSKKLAIVGAVPLEGTFANVHLVVLIDITERRKTERQLEESRRLAALGALAGGIAHDFNNLLTPILSHAEVTLSELPPESSLVAGLSEIHTAASRAAALVRQILVMSRPSDESKTRVALGPLVEEVVKLLRASVPSTISIRMHLAPDAPAVFASATRLHRVILNLAMNARDAMEKTGGTLLISVRKGQENQLELSVSDTGMGIDAEIMERIFEPYFTTKKSSGGTGLGLATVHSIITSLGGTIAIKSVVNKGTTVDVRLPAMPERRSALPVSNAQAPKKEPPGAHGRGLHVLVVDDETLVARAASRLLARIGYRVTVAIGSAQAIDIFRADPSVAAVLTDHTMPEMTGLELAKVLYNIRPTPILLATGYAENLTDEAVREAQVKRILSKPYSITMLSDALAAVLPDDQSKE